MKRYDKYKLASVLALTAALATAPTEATQSYETKSLEMARQPLNVALQRLSNRFDVQIASFSEDITGKTVRKLSGEYSLQDALTAALSGSGLYYLHVDDRTIAVGTSERLSAQYQKAGYKVISFNTAADYEAKLAPSLDDEKIDEVEGFSIEEIVITATKRGANLQNVPLAVSAIGERDIERKGLVGMTDYLTFVPGVTMQEMGVGQNQIVIRGLATGIFEQPTVTTYLGEVPLTNALSDSSIDIKLVDMQRVEVLRGPQGTLFGGGALSGAVRNIPNAPDLSEFGGKLEVDYGHTEHSDSDNGSVTGIVNVPLVEDKLAVRVAAYRFESAGYVDLVSTDRIEALSQSTGLASQVQKDTGGNTYTGVRASVLWQANENLDVTLMLGYQKLEEHGQSEALFGLGGYQSDTLRLGPDSPDESRINDFKMANLVINYDLEWATVTSSTVLYENDTQQTRSFSRTSSLAADLIIDDNSEDFMQEVRLASQLDGPFQYIVGVYYEDFDFTRGTDLLWTGNSTSLLNTFDVTDTNILSQVSADAAEQMAVFAELSYQITDTIKLTAGGRGFDYTRKVGDQSTGFFAGASVDEETKESGSIFKAGLDYTPNDDTLLYASWSQGFRLGNNVPEDGFAIQQCDTNNDGLHDEFGLPFFSGTRESDTTNNYELGGKFSFMDKRLVMNAAVFRIDWSNIPFLFFGSCGSVSGSAASARSQGIEFETSYYVTEDLQVNLSASYIDAEFTEDLGVGTPITKGARLPLSAEVNGSLGVQYEFALSNNPAFVRSDVSYVGSYITNPNLPLSGDYVKLDMRAGITLDKFDVEVYAKNLNGTDKKVNHFSGQRVWLVKPRTIGMNIRYHF